MGAATIDDTIIHIISEGTGLSRPQAMAYFERLPQFDPKDVQQGIFFIAADNPAEEVRTEVYSAIRSNEVYFQISALQPKDYSLIVKSSFIRGRA